MSSRKKKMSQGQIERAATLFAALAEPSRLVLLQALMHEGTLSVSELVAASGLSQANVSKHLSGLYAARLVTKERKGVYVCYRIIDSLAEELCSLVCGKIERDAIEEIEALKNK